MPATKYTPTLAIYNCIQYDGTNFTEIAAMGAPVIQEGEKVHMNVIAGLVNLPVGYWVMQDMYGLYSMLSDEEFQIGYKPGGGP